MNSPFNRSARLLLLLVIVISSSLLRAAPASAATLGDSPEAPVVNINEIVKPSAPKGSSGAGFTTRQVHGSW